MTTNKKNSVTGSQSLPERIIDYVKNVPDKDFSRVDVYHLSLKFSIPLHELSREYKKETGEQLKVLLQQERLKRSRRLLKNTGLQIKEIAAIVGYSVKHFGDFFKKHMKVSPSVYRPNPPRPKKTKKKKVKKKQPETAPAAVQVKPGQIAMLNNSVYYLIETVFVEKTQKGARLVVYHNAKLHLKEDYKSVKGAKIAFLKFFSYRAIELADKGRLEKLLQPEWTHFYKPTVPGWLRKYGQYMDSIKKNKG